MFNSNANQGLKGIFYIDSFIYYLNSLIIWYLCEKYVVLTERPYGAKNFV